MNSTQEEKLAVGDYIFQYTPLVLIGIAVTNIITILLITCIKELRHQATMNYIFLMAITDTVCLFLWNFNHYSVPVLKIALEFMNLPSCKILVFIQYVSLQTSALLVCMMCIDQLAYLIMTRKKNKPFVHYLPFNTKKSARLWSLTILGVTFLINIHILMFNGSPLNGTSSGASCYSAIYDITSVMNTIHLVVYTFIPIAIVTIADIAILVLFCKKRNQAKYAIKLKQQRIKVLPTQDVIYRDMPRSSYFSQGFVDHSKSMTPTVLFISISFIILTQPPAILYGFFEYSPFYADKKNRFIFHTLDFIMFLNHCIIFFKCLLSSSLFRQAISKHLCCCCDYDEENTANEIEAA